MVQVTALGIPPRPDAAPASETAQNRGAFAKPRRRTLAVAAVCLVALALGVAFALLRTNGSAERDGTALLALVLPDTDGHDQPLAQWRGKVLVVNFWATWCAPCREEMPQFVRVQARDGAKGVQFVGIAVDDAAKVRAFANELGVNYPTLIGGFGAIELSRTLGNELSALPFTIVVDRQGHVAHTQLGPLKAQQLDTLLGRLLHGS